MEGARVTSYIASATDVFVVDVVGALARRQAVRPRPAGDCSEGEARKALPTDTSGEGGGGIERERMRI